MQLTWGIGFPIAMHLLTVLCVCMNLWLKTKFHSTPSYYAEFSAVLPISFPKYQGGIKGKEI